MNDEAVTTRPRDVPAVAEPAPIPWEERPAAVDTVLWRSSRNPIIPRDHIPRANSIFNSAVVSFRDGFAGVFRVDDRSRTMQVHAGPRSVLYPVLSWRYMIRSGTTED